MAANTTDETVDYNSEGNGQGPTNPKDQRTGYSSVSELLRANYLNTLKKGATSVKPLFEAAKAGKLPVQKEQAKQEAKPAFSMKDVEAAAMAEMKPKTEAIKPAVKEKEVTGEKPTGVSLQKSKANINTYENAMIAVDNQAKLYANALPADMPMRDVFVAQKKEDFLSRFKSGELRIAKDDKGFPVLKRVIDGTIVNFIDGVQSTLSANAQVADFDMMDKDEQIAFMKGNKRVEVPTISEAGRPSKTRYLDKPMDKDLGTVGMERRGAFAETSAMMGGVMPDIGTGITVGAIPGLGEVLSPLVVGAVQGKRQQFDSKNQAFQLAKQRGLSDDDAYEVANNFWNSKVSLMTGAAEGVVSQYLGSKTLHKFAELAPARDLKSFGQAAKAFIKDAAVGAKELALAGTLDGAVAYSMEKIRGGSDDSAEEQFKAEFLTQLGFAAIGGAVSVPKYVKSYAYNAISNLDNQTIYNNMVAMEQAGLVEEGVAKKTVEDVNKFRETKGRVMVANQDAAPTVAGLTIKAEAIQEQIKNTPETNVSALNALNTELQQVNERISRAQASQDPLAEEVDDATGLNIKTKQNATTISEGQEGSTTSGISQYQGTKGVQTQTSNEADNRYSAFGSQTQQQKIIIDINNAETVKIDNPKNFSDRAINAASNVIYALKSVNPGLKVMAMPTIQEYGDALVQGELDNGEAVSKQRERDLRGSNGAYDPTNNVIYLNLENIRKKAKVSTLFHEGAHPIINMIAEQNSEAVSTLYNQLRDLSETIDGVNGVLAFGDGYSIYGDDTVKSEAIVEFIARVADGQIKLPVEQPTVMKNIIDVIKGFLDIIGLGTDINSIDDIKSIAAKIKDAFQTGKEVVIVSETTGSATEAGITSNTVVINAGNIKSTGRFANKEGLNLEIAERNFDEKNLKFIDISDIDGANAFIFAADKAVSAIVKSPSGYMHEFNGGVGYSYQDGTGVWAFTTKAAAQKFLNRAKESDGVGLIMSQKEEGITGSYDFYGYMIGELYNAIDKGVSEKDLVKYLDGKLDTNVTKGVTFRQLLANKGKKTSIESIADLENLMPIDGPSKFSYEQRGGFTKKVFSAFTEKNFGIPRLETALAISNDPIVKNAEYGDIVAAIQVDKNSPIIDTRTDNRFKNHPSYPFVVTGSPIGVFNEFYDVRDIAPDFVPKSKEANQTPLSERGKPQAAKSAMGAQPVIKVGKKLALQIDTENQYELKVKDVYADNKELSKIGTQQDYSNYIKSIFPDSEVKDIVYHSSNSNFDVFDKSKISSRKEGAPKGGDVGAFGKGIYFTPNKDYSKSYGKNLKSVVLNINNPKIILNNEANDKLYQNKSIQELWGDYDSVIYKITDWKAVSESGVHSSIEEFNSIGLGKNNKPEVVDIAVDDINKIHILGSNQDVQDFKEWKKSNVLQLQKGNITRKSAKQTAKQNARTEDDAIASLLYNADATKRAQESVEKTGIIKKISNTYKNIRLGGIENQASVRDIFRREGAPGALADALLTTSRGYGAQATLASEDIGESVYGGLSDKKDIDIAGTMVSDVQLLNQIMNQRRVVAIQNMVKEKFDELQSMRAQMKKLRSKAKKEALQTKIDAAVEYLQDRKVLGKKYNPQTEQTTEYLQNYQVGSTVDAAGNKVPYNAGFASKQLEVLSSKYDGFKDLNERADKMFNAYRGLMKEKLQEGLISKEQYEYNTKYDYVPISYIDKILQEQDPDYTRITSKNPNQIRKSILGGGSDGDILTDYSAIFEVFAVNHYKNIATNRAAQGLVNFIKSVPNNGLVEIANPLVDEDGDVKIDKEGNPIFPTAPEGKAYIYFYQDGKKMAILADKAFEEEWNAKYKQGDELNVLSNIALSSIAQKLFTGKNPGFGIFQMIALDPLTAAVSTDVFSKSVPLAYAQIAVGGKDMVGWKGSIQEVIGRGDKYRLAAKWGAFTEMNAGKELETSITKATPDQANGSVYQKVIKKVADFTSKPTEYIDKAMDATGLGKVSDVTEKATRLIIFDRARKVFTDKFVEENNRQPDAKEMDNIYAMSAAEARRSSDFSRGGSIIKPASRLLIYLNSAVQTKVSVINQARKNPARFAYQVGELLTVGGLLMAYSAGAIPAPWDTEEEKKKRRDAYNSLSEYQKLNYLNIYVGGDKPERAFIKIPIPPVFNNFWTSAVMAFENKYNNANYTAKDFVLNMASANPFGDVTEIPSRVPPSAGAMLAYNNIDIFTKKEIVADEADLPDELEGATDESVSIFYKKMGQLTGLSPARTQVAVKKIVGDPTKNPMIYLPKVALETAVELATGAPLSVKEGFEKDWKGTLLNGLSLQSRFFAGTPRFYQTQFEGYLREMNHLQSKAYGSLMSNDEESFNKYQEQIAQKKKEAIAFLEPVKKAYPSLYDKMVTEAEGPMGQKKDVTKSMKESTKRNYIKDNYDNNVYQAYIINDPKIRAKYIYDQVQGMDSAEKKQYFGILYNLGIANQSNATGLEYKKLTAPKDK